MNTKKKSVKSVDKNPITPEVLPPETQPSSLSHHPSEDPLTEQAIQFHNAAKHHAGLAVVYAAMCGFAIRKKKAELGHANGFSAWKKALPFDTNTAERYMNLSKEFETRMPELQGTGDFSPTGLLECRSDDTLAGLDVEYFAEQVKDLAGGRTLTQLYFDWGICKPPHQLGGNPALQKWLAEFHPRVKATRPEDLTSKLRKAFEKWCAEQDAEAVKNHDPIKEARETAVYHYKDLTLKMYDFMHRHYADLPRGELRALKDSFNDYAKQIEQAIQKG